MDKTFSIGQLSAETGTKVVTVRYYEQTGLLPSPERSAGNYRTYGNEHVDRLRFIRRCRELGFSIDQIRELLRLSSEQVETCASVCEVAARHLREIEQKLVDLKRLANQLKRITASCSGARPMSDCRIIESLSRVQ